MSLHPADTDLYIDYKGWRFRPPFHCMYCGVEVDPLQWAFSRSCAGCDVSESRTARLSIYDPRIFAGPHELIDPHDAYFLNEDRFLSPTDAEKYPVLNPSKPLPLPIPFTETLPYEPLFPNSFPPLPNREPEE